MADTFESYSRRLDKLNRSLSGPDMEKLLATVGLDAKKDAAEAVTGGLHQCSDYCFNEQEKGYLFVDKARFKLSGCDHHSQHVQCFLTALICDDFCHSYCPVRDSPKCHDWA